MANVYTNLGLYASFVFVADPGRAPACLPDSSPGTRHDFSPLQKAWRKLRRVLTFKSLID